MRKKKKTLRKQTALVRETGEAKYCTYVMALLAKGVIRAGRVIMAPELDLEKQRPGTNKKVRWAKLSNDPNCRNHVPNCLAKGTTLRKGVGTSQRGAPVKGRTENVESVAGEAH